MTGREIEDLLRQLTEEVARLHALVELLLAKHNDNEEKMRVEWSES